jgi:hypothetical protein
MEKVVCRSGVILYWDSTLQVGDLITVCGTPGFHILESIEFRDGTTPLMGYVTVVKADGKKVKSPKAICHIDASLVRRVTREDIQRLYELDVNSAIIRRDNLLEFATR